MAGNADDKSSGPTGPQVLFGVDRFKVAEDIVDISLPIGPPSSLADVVYVLSETTGTPVPSSTAVVTEKGVAQLERIEEPIHSITLMEGQDEPWVKVKLDDGTLKKVTLPMPDDPDQKQVAQIFQSVLCTQASAIEDQGRRIKSQDEILRDKEMILEQERKERSRETAEVFDALAIYRDRLIKMGVDVELPNELSRTAYRVAKWEEMDATRKIISEAEAEQLKDEVPTNQREKVTCEECSDDDDDDEKLIEANVDTSPEFLAALKNCGIRKSRKTEVIGYPPGGVPPVRFSKQLSPIGEVSHEEPVSDVKKRGTSTKMGIEDQSFEKKKSKQDAEVPSPKLKEWRIYKKDGRVLPTPPKDVMEVFAREKEKLKQIKSDVRKPTKTPVKPSSELNLTRKKSPSKTSIVFENKYMVEVGGKYIDMRKPPVNLTLGEMEILLDRLRIMEEKDIVEQQLNFIVKHLTNLGVEEVHVNNLLKFGTRIPLKSREEIEKRYAKDLLKKFPEFDPSKKSAIREMEKKYESVLDELVELKKTIIIGQSTKKALKKKKRADSTNSSSSPPTSDSDSEEERRIFNPFRKSADISKTLEKTAKLKSATGGSSDPNDDDSDHEKRDRRHRDSDDRSRIDKNQDRRRNYNEDTNQRRRKDDRDDRHDQDRRRKPQGPSDDDGDDSDPHDSGSESDGSRDSRRSDDSRRRRRNRNNRTAKSTGGRTYSLNLFDVSGNPLQPINVHIPEDGSRRGGIDYNRGSGVYTTRAMDLTKVERYQGPADKRSPAAFIRLFEYYTSTCKDDVEKGRYFINRMDFEQFPGSKSYKEKWGYKKMKKMFIQNEWNRTSRINLLQKLDSMEYDCIGG